MAIHTRKDPYTRYGQPLALKIGRTCLVYRVIREFRVGNVLIYIRSPVQAVAEAKTWMKILHGTSSPLGNFLFTCNQHNKFLLIISLCKLSILALHGYSKI